MPRQNPAPSLDPETIVKLREAVVRRASRLDWVNPGMFREVIESVQAEGVEVTALWCSLFFDFDPRHRFGALRRLAVAMESHPPRTFGQALAFVCATLLEFTWIAHHGGLSRFGPAEAAAKLRPAFKGIALPAWEPPYPHCAGSPRSSRRRTKHPHPEAEGDS